MGQELLFNELHDAQRGFLPLAIRVWIAFIQSDSRPVFLREISGLLKSHVPIQTQLNRLRPPASVLPLEPERDAIAPHLGVEALHPTFVEDFVFILPRRYFQQRHSLAHKDGIIDSDYIARSADSTYQAGQRLVVKQAAVRECLALVVKLVMGMKSP